MNLGGKICIVSVVWLSVSGFAGFKSSIYMFNLFWRSISLSRNQKSAQILLQVFQVVLLKSWILSISSFLGELLRRACSTSLSGGNYVDGSPPALNTAAVLVVLRMEPRRLVN